MEGMKRPVLTLRFSKRRSYARLKRASEMLGVSMNALADAAIERELDFLAVDLADELEETARLLRDWTYTDRELAHDLDQIAEAEAGLRDPVRAYRVDLREGQGVVDVAEVFSSPSP